MHFTTAVSSLALVLPLALTQPTASLKARFAGGQCGLHITQHQKNEDGVGADYKYDLRIIDSIGVTIGGANGLDIADYQSSDVASQLPATVTIYSGGIDADAIRFAYNGQSWDTGSGQCKIGGYDGGSRLGDCGFSC